MLKLRFDWYLRERGWAKLELTDAEVGVYTKIMPWILLYLWSRVSCPKGRTPM